MDGGGPALAVLANESSLRQGSVFGVMVLPSGVASLADLLRAVQQAIASFPAGVTEPEVAVARRWLVDRRRLGIEGSMPRALRLAARGSWGLDDYDTIDASAVAEPRGGT